MVRWAPLTSHLRDDGRDRISLTYDEIGAILGGHLPASATNHRPMIWANAATNEYSKHWRRAGYRTALAGVPTDVVVFLRDQADHSGDPRRATAGAGAAASAARRIVLVGCVKSKAAEPLPARALYVSPLFAKRRGYAERSGNPWMVLSAEYGLVDPDAVVAPYDRRLASQSARYRRQWGERVVRQLEDEFGDLHDATFELHAGRAYGDPIEPGLRARGANLARPLDGLTHGRQLAWYGHTPPEPPPDDVSPPDMPRRQPQPPGLARLITQDFCAGDLRLPRHPGEPVPGWAGMPEIIATDRMRDLGAGPVGVRSMLTFIAAMDRARDADLLWQRGAMLWESAPWRTTRPR